MTKKDYEVSEDNTMNRPRVFIGSTVLDLPDQRAAVVDACLRVGVQPLTPKEFAHADVLTRLCEAIDQSDIYIGILSFRYGWVPQGEEKSITEIEFELAGAKGIPRLMFLMSEDHPIRVQDIETGDGAVKLKSFKAAVRRSVLVTEFRSADELKAAVVTALVGVLGETTAHSHPRTALLLLPFGAEHDELRKFLSAELQREGVRVLRLEEMFQTGAIWANAITDAIGRADLVVVDVTNPSPNLMYELGYAHALRKPMIILAESTAIRSIPSDLAGFQLLAYDREDLGFLSKPLARFLREYIGGGRR
jgi:hypothetical protein